METDSWLRLSSVPRRAFGESPLPSDWYLGSPEFPGRRREDLPDGRVTGSLGTIMPSGDPPFLYLFLMRSFPIVALGSWHPPFRKDMPKLEDVQR